MFYKLSNTAEVNEIEDYFEVPMSYPKLYNKKMVIDGLKEENLVIRTVNNPEKLQLGIWGLLPEQYMGSWKAFQNIKNTLNFNTDLLKTDPCFNDALYNRRCLIVVTGFFTSYLVDGHAYPFYVHLTSGKPFCLAGIYNELDDGFITCSLLVTNKSEPLKKIQNLSCEMPLVINKLDSANWLNKNSSREEINDIIDNPKRLLFNVYPITQKLYEDKNDKNLLEKVEYSKLRLNY